MARPLALIIDDEADLRLLMRMALTRMDIECVLAENLKEAYQALEQHQTNHQPFSFCLTDLNLPDGSGLDLVSYITSNYPKLPVAVITAYGSMDIAVEALKMGAYDFVSKPLEISRLRVLVERALKIETSDVVADKQQQLASQLMLGECDSIKAIRTTLTKLARSQAPVYISGESGTGKEIAARLLHLLGPRSNHAFVAINCGAIPSELMESEFFGHRKGSFTGATEDKLGLFQSAQGGTLFLDEVADLPLTMQVKLLRAIQEKKIRPIGSQTELPVDVRILSASHKPLLQQVESGRFRQDLYYRINVIEVALPPLRSRGQDILLLANALLARICKDWDINTPHLSNQAQQLLLKHTFPGNVRELQNTIERALSLCDGDTILPEHLGLLTLASHQPIVASQYSDDASALDNETTVPLPFTLPLATATIAPWTQADILNQKGLPIHGLEVYLELTEKYFLLKALECSQWNKTAAAKKLGLSFRTLRYRLKKLELDNGSDDDTDLT